MLKALKVLGILIVFSFFTFNFASAEVAQCLTDAGCFGCMRCSNYECVSADGQCGACESCVAGVCVSDCQSCEDCTYVSYLGYVCVDNCDSGECLECRNGRCRSECRAGETCVDGECVRRGRLIPETPTGTDEMQIDEEGGWTVNFRYTGETSTSTTIEIDSGACSNSRSVSNVTSDQSISCSGKFDYPGVRRVEGHAGNRSSMKNVTVHAMGSETIDCKHAEIEVRGAGGGGAGGEGTATDGGGSRYFRGIFDVSDVDEIFYWIGAGGQGGESEDSGRGGTGLEEGGRGGIHDGSPEHAGGGGGSTVVAADENPSSDDFIVAADGGGGGAYGYSGVWGCYSWAGGGGGAGGDGGYDDDGGDHGEDGDSPVLDRDGRGGGGANSGLDDGTCYAVQPGGQGATERNSDQLVSSEDWGAVDSGGDSGSSRGRRGDPGEVSFECLPDPANFEVDYIETDKDEYGEGEPIEIEARITNTGDESDNQTITVNLGDEEYEENISLEGGEQEFITNDDEFYVPMDVGDHDIEVESEDDSLEKSIQVSEANFEFYNWEINPSETGGSNEIEISGEIENKSEVGGRDYIVMKVNDEYYVDEEGEEDEYLGFRDGRYIGLGAGESTEDSDTPEISFSGKPEDDWEIEELGEYIDVEVRTDELDNGDDWESEFYLYAEPRVENKTVIDHTDCESISPETELQWDYVDENHSDYTSNQDHFYLKIENKEAGEVYEFDNSTYLEDGDTFSVHLDKHLNEGELDFSTEYGWEVQVEDDNGVKSGWEKGPDFRTPEQYPDVKFSFSPENPYSEEVVNFVDESTIYTSDLSEVVSRKWDFGGGATPEILEGSDGDYIEAQSEYSDSGGRNIVLEVTDEDEDANEGEGVERTCSAERSISVGEDIPEWEETDPFSMIINLVSRHFYSSFGR